MAKTFASLPVECALEFLLPSSRSLLLSLCELILCFSLFFTLALRSCSVLSLFPFFISRSFCRVSYSPWLLFTRGEITAEATNFSVSPLVLRKIHFSDACACSVVNLMPAFSLFRRFSPSRAIYRVISSFFFEAFSGIKINGVSLPPLRFYMFCSIILTFFVDDLKFD